MDRRGNVCLLRLPVLILVSMPAAVMLSELLLGLLGPEPDKELIRETGEWTLRLLLVSLAVTPFSVCTDTPKLVYVRRLIGVATCCYAVAHLAQYVIYNNFHLWKVTKEIGLRFYLTIGFVALLGLVALAWTSTEYWTKRLGKRWKQLHRLVYPITALALLHFFIQSKADVSEPVLVSGLFVWLMTWRALPQRSRGHWATPFLLIPVAGLGAALVEFVWCLSATSFPALRVLQANLDLDFGPRPAVWAAIVALGVACFMATLRHGGEWVGRLRQA